MSRQVWASWPWAVLLQASSLSQRAPQLWGASHLSGCGFSCSGIFVSATSHGPCAMSTAAPSHDRQRLGRGHSHRQVEDEAQVRAALWVQSMPACRSSTGRPGEGPSTAACTWHSTTLAPSSCKPQRVSLSWFGAGPGSHELADAGGTDKDTVQPGRRSEGRTRLTQGSAAVPLLLEAAF